MSSFRRHVDREARRLPEEGRHGEGDAKMRYKVNDPEETVENAKTNSSVSWNYNQRDEKTSGSKKMRLVILVGLLVVTVIALVAALTLQIAIFRREEHRELCQSEECIKTAARVIDAMDRSVDPCEDFYSFACGGWINKHPIPQSQGFWDQLSLVREELLENLRVLLEEPDKETDFKQVKMARAFYKICMDAASAEALGLEPIYEVFHRLGLSKNPPMPGKTSSLDISRILGVARRMLDLNLFVHFYISEDIKNTTRNRIMMEQVTPIFNEHYLLDPSRFQSELKEYRKYIKSMVETIGAGNMSANYANDILEFSTKVAKIMETDEERRSPDHLLHDVTIDELQQLTDLHAQEWNWTTYIQAVFEDTNVTINPTVDRVIVTDLRYLQELPVLLSVTPSITIARFVWWGVYSYVAPLTLQRFRDLAFEFLQKVFGLKEKTPRWKECATNANANFGMAISNVYARKHFNEQAREKALKMLLDIRTAFDEMVTELDWMDVDTKARAHRKLSAMRPFVGFPDWITDAEEMDKYYKGAEIIDKKLFATFMQLIDVAVRKNLDKLREKPDRSRWISSGTTVNAFYSATLNSVTFPAGILQPPFYGNGLESINYGAMGAMMGHEFTHGFDDQGRRYDENGNLRQWWSNKTLQHYHEEVECMVRQYGSYHLSELGDNFTINGINTQSENIADNGGIRQAYRAYQRLIARDSYQQALPGLVDYSNEQLFFLGFAQVWCGNYTYGALKTKIIADVHAPNRFRVIGALSNNLEFAKAWKCPVGAAMNPPHKCILW
ncbi:hypothetical protein HN011_005253 [Eciton burchellii]|nr:hypothetical protein HN011_005253 [Eciton burchellii]